MCGLRKRKSKFGGTIVVYVIYILLRLRVYIVMCGSENIGCDALAVNVLMPFIVMKLPSKTLS